MAAVAEAGFQAGLLETARRNGTLRRDFQPPPQWRRNTPERLREALAPFRRDGTLPDYPLGSDFTPVEQRLVRALGWLQARTATRPGALRTAAAAVLRADARDHEALARMDLARPAGAAERLYARLLRLALARTAAG